MRAYLQSWVSLALALMLFHSTGCRRSDTGEQSGAEGSGAFASLINVGAGYIENRQGEKAIDVLNRAVEIRPESAAALRNLARAHLAVGKPENDRAALGTLERASHMDADSTATIYLTGLAHSRLNEFGEAIASFEKAVRQDPGTATLRYQLAAALEAVGEDARAKQQYLETVRLDPLQASAQYKLANCARKARDRDELQRRMLEFQRLKDLFGEQPASVLEACVYTEPERGPFDVGAQQTVNRPAIKVTWEDATDRVFQSPTARKALTMTVLDVDELGHPALFVTREPGWYALVKMTEDRFVETPVDVTGDRTVDVTQCIAANFHIQVAEKDRLKPRYDAPVSVYCVGNKGSVLLEPKNGTQFVNVAASAGLSGASGHRATWVDYEHDGDLDIVVAGGHGVSLWQNNGDATFTNVTTDVGLPDDGHSEGAVDAVAVELDNNVAIDLVIARNGDPTDVYVNQRTGRFAKSAEPPGPWPAATSVLANDLDNDGHNEVVMIHDNTLTIKHFDGESWPGVPLSGMRASGGLLFDYDNDGWLDVLIFGSADADGGQGAIRLLRNMGSSQFEDVSQLTELGRLNAAAIRDAVSADFDGDGDSDLLLLDDESALHFWRNNGGNANHQLKLKLVTIKTNPSGIGTHVELRRGTHWITRAISESPIEIGVGSLSQLDTLQTVWTNGVVDNKIDVAIPDRPLVIEEKLVATGSCPLLFAWNGERFRCVTDLLGNSPIGLPLARNVMLPADPDEFVHAGTDDDLRPDSGRLLLEVVNRFREITYLDTVALASVEHPIGTEIHSTDKIMPPPFPESRLWKLEQIVAPSCAAGDDGVDRTAAVSAIDDLFAPPGPSLPSQLRGMCLPMTLTLDFGKIDATEPLVLALTGWLQYGDASTNIALSQSNSVEVIPPNLDVESVSGEWSAVDVVVGMPAGKTKTILCDLSGKLPIGARRLRLTTTFEIRWDRIALGRRVPLDETDIQLLSPGSAELHWLGFPAMRAKSPSHPTVGYYDELTNRPEWRTALEGWCTRYGDVAELLARRDGELAILNAGDAVRLEFDPGNIALAEAGMTRSYFFYSVGWDKDGDHNVTDGDRVGPLPVASNEDWTEAPPPDDWRLRFNTRWVGRDAWSPQGQ